MKELVLQQYRKYEGHDESLTVDDVAFLHEIVNDDFMKIRPTKIEGTYAEVHIEKEVKQWYELGDCEFMVTNLMEKSGRTRITVELTGVA